MIVEKYQYYFDLIRVLVAKELKVRYKGTWLGYAWSILHPLAFAIVYFFVFKIVMRIKIENYALFIICGLFPWQWFSSSLSGSTTIFIANYTLIKKVSFPRQFLVLTGVLNDLIHFIFAIPVLVAFMLYFHQYPSLSWFYQVPILIVTQFCFVYGMSLLLATYNVFFRDLERLITILIMIWFFITPVIYPLKMIPDGFRMIILYGNPMALIITCWKSIFLEGQLPLRFIGITGCYALTAYFFGIKEFKRLNWRFAEIV